MFAQMGRWCLGAILTLMLLLPIAPTQAQVLGTFLTSPETSSDGQDYDQILKSAAENGVSVVVIDSEGNIITQGGKADQEVTETARDSAALMKAQSSAVEFRAALVERLLNLPTAFNEVLFILRSSSPDGTIWTFFEALFFSLLLFGIWIGELGLNYEVYAFLASLMSFSVMLLNMIMVAMNRSAIANALM
ncbi:MAG: hypothetical protein ABJ246_11415, partial [Paracoccaceae bacterium]